MGKTAIEWFNTVNDLILRDLLIERCNSSLTYFYYTSLSEAISLTFDWYNTDEGVFYWCKLYDILVKNGQ